MLSYETSAVSDTLNRVAVQKTPSASHGLTMHQAMLRPKALEPCGTGITRDLGGTMQSWLIVILIDTSVYMFAKIFMMLFALRWCSAWQAQETSHHAQGGTYPSQPPATWALLLSALQCLICCMPSFEPDTAVLA